ncbi:hypothetical protein PENSPDRAFT_735947 [Peniophora sp. CONT]|nr:hypothetical protein PENSPDRAFT_735947 [Peniophora sp. CONT]
MADPLNRPRQPHGNDLGLIQPDSEKEEHEWREEMPMRAACRFLRCWVCAPRPPPALPLAMGCSPIGVLPNGRKKAWMRSHAGIYFAILTGMPVAHLVTQPFTTLVSTMNDTSEPLALSSQHSAELALASLVATLFISKTPQPSRSDFAIALPPTPTITLTPLPAGSLPSTSSTRTQPAVAAIDDISVPSEKLRHSPSIFTRMMLSRTARPPTAPAFGPAELRGQVSVMKAVIHDLRRCGSKNTYALESQGQTARVHVLQQDVLQLPELQAQIRFHKAQRERYTSQARWFADAHNRSGRIEAEA